MTHNQNEVQDKLHGLVIQCKMMHDNDEYEESRSYMNECQTIFNKHYKEISSNKSLCYDFCEAYRIFQQFEQHQFQCIKYMRKSLEYITNPDQKITQQTRLMQIFTDTGRYSKLIHFGNQIHSTTTIHYQFYIDVFNAYWLRDDMYGMNKWLQLIQQKMHRFKDTEYNSKVLYWFSQIKYDTFKAKYKSDYERIRKTVNHAMNKLHIIDMDEAGALRYYIDVVKGDRWDVGCEHMIHEFFEVDAFLMMKCANIMSAKGNFHVNKIYIALYFALQTNIYILYYFALFCYKFKHYILSKRLLIEALSNSQRNKIKMGIIQIDKVLDTICCEYCGKSRKKKRLRVCVGCGNVYYCNRRCQKRSWNYKHRTKCSGKWTKCWQDIQKIKLGKYISPNYENSCVSN
eukprot:280154_1